MQTEKNDYHAIYGTDLTRPLPELIETIRSQLTKTRGQLFDIAQVHGGYREHFKDMEGLLTTGIQSLYYLGQRARKDETARAMQRGNDVPTAADPRLYPANPRPMGSGWGQCFVCGTGDKTTLHPDCAWFVPSRETGEVIVSLFKQGAVLDYRPFEPQWVQVKITACHKHEGNLRKLIELAQETRHRIDGPGLNAAMIAEAIAYEPVEQEPDEPTPLQQLLGGHVREADTE